MWPESQGSAFSWRVREFTFGWSGGSKVWTGWERVLTTPQAVAEVFRRMHAFGKEAEGQAWI
jgi:hypothetical protein